jgi:hypothetical protein
VISGGEGAAALERRIIAGLIVGESLPIDKSFLLSKIAVESSLIQP